MKHNELSKDKFSKDLLIILNNLWEEHVNTVITKLNEDFYEIIYDESNYSTVNHYLDDQYNKKLLQVDDYIDRLSGAIYNLYNPIVHVPHNPPVQKINQNSSSALFGNNTSAFGF